jgi:hypothetical protein
VYTTKINGPGSLVGGEVHQYGAVAYFDFAGDVTVKVTASGNAPVPTAVVRPLSYGIKPEIAGKTVTFRLQVAAGETARQDWAVWASAAIVQDLVVGRVSAPAMRSTAAAKTEVMAQPQGGMAAKPKLELAAFNKVNFRPIPLTPAGSAPPKHAIEDAGPLAIEEPLTLLNRIYKDNIKPNTYYFLPREINLIREKATGDYRVSAVWTQDQKIRTTLTLQANIDPSDVNVMEEALKAAKGTSAVLKSMPYDEANIIDMKGWEDWQIENIRIPTFGSLETELPISIGMTILDVVDIVRSKPPI